MTPIPARRCTRPRAWSQAQGRKTIDESFAEYARSDADDEFWDLAIARPGAEHIFDDPTYYRGAMTLRALQKLIGDAEFNQLVKAWFRNHAQGNVSTEDFIALAERISGRDLDRFFADWVYSTDKPEELSVYTGARNSAARSAGDAAAAATAPTLSWLRRARAGRSFR